MARELVWITPSGEEFALTAPAGGYRVLKGATGLLAPPIDLSTDTTPLLDGVAVTDVYAPPRTIMLPMLILAAGSQSLYRARVLALVAALAHGRECALELRQPDGQRRRITAWYSGGLEGVEDKDTGGETWTKVAIRLLCPDPYWYDPEPIRLTYEYVGTPPEFLSDPFLPLKLAAGTVLGTGTITNPGEVLSWPVWTVTPPADELELTDIDRDLTIPIAAEVPTGQTLTIVTQPGAADIRLSDGTDYWEALYGSPTLWPIHPGDTAIDLALTGASTGSKVTVEWYPRYKTPL